MTRAPRRSRRSGSRAAGSGTSGSGRRRPRCCGRTRRPRSGWSRPGPLRRNSHCAPMNGRRQSCGRRRLHRDRLQRLVLDVDLEVVLEVGADTGQVGHDRDAERARGRRRARPRTAGAAAGVLIAPPARMISPPSIRSVPPPCRSMSTATARRPSNTTPVTNVRVRTVRFLRPTDRLQVRLRGGQPPAVVDVAIERREPLLAVAVDVVGQVIAGLLAGGEERLEQRVRGRTALQDERPVMTAPRIVGRGREAGLHLLEVRQAMGVVPRLHARDRPPSARSRADCRAGRSGR